MKTPDQQPPEVINPAVAKITRAIEALPEELRQNVIALLKKELDRLPTTNELWRNAREGSGSPSSMSEKTFGSIYQEIIESIRQITGGSSEAEEICGVIRYESQDHIEEALLAIK